MYMRLINWIKNFTFYACQGYWSESTTINPSEFDCEANDADEITCEQCLCNGGMYNPDTGKKDYIRYFFINYKDWIKRKA
jgi:hypothetical protein